MAGWDYIIGETGYNRPFVLFDQGTGKAVDGTGITSATMDIRNSDLSPNITGTVLTVDTVNPLRVLLPVNSSTPNVPQTTGSYLATITITIGAEIRKTFELDLRVFNG
jgi:hypothetical protein